MKLVENEVKKSAPLFMQLDVAIGIQDRHQIYEV